MILIFIFIFVNYNLQGPTENRLGEWVPWINIFIIIIIIISILPNSSVKRCTLQVTVPLLSPRLSAMTVEEENLYIEMGVTESLKSYSSTPKNTEQKLLVAIGSLMLMNLIMAFGSFLLPLK